jgi:hypothetical protein
MLVGLTNQCNLLSGLGGVLNALSLPRTAFFRWVSEVIRLCAGLAGAVVADITVVLLRGLVAVQGGRGLNARDGTADMETEPAEEQLSVVGGAVVVSEECESCFSVMNYRLSWWKVQCYAMRTQHVYLYLR